MQKNPRDLVSLLERTPVTLVEGYLRRGDFSSWIGEVFGDYPLAAGLRALEELHRAAVSPDTVPEIVPAIRGRYDVVPANQVPAAH